MGAARSPDRRPADGRAARALARPPPTGGSPARTQRRLEAAVRAAADHRRPPRHLTRVHSGGSIALLGRSVTMPAMKSSFEDPALLAAMQAFVAAVSALETATDDAEIMERSQAK